MLKPISRPIAVLKNFSWRNPGGVFLGLLHMVSSKLKAEIVDATSVINSDESRRNSLDRIFCSRESGGTVS